MKRVKHWWQQQVPASVRKPVVLIVGSLFILLAAATGWLPGPGGIPLFLVGVAILATEFVWAERFRDRILDVIKAVGHWYRAHKVIGTIIFVVAAACAAAVAYFSFIRFRA